MASVYDNMISPNRQYGGAGGFMSSPTDGQQQQVTRAQLDRTQVSTRPVSLQMIVDANRADNDGPYKLDGYDINQIIVCGRVEEMKVSSVMTVFSIRDGSGPTMQLKMYVNKDDKTNPTENSSFSNLQRGSYLKAFGIIKEFNSVRNINAYHVWGVTDPAEMRNHVLETMYVTLFLRHGSLNATGNTASHGGASSMPAAAVHGAPSGTTWAQPQHDLGQQQSFGGGPSGVILAAVKANKTPEGAHIRTLISCAAGQYTEEQVKECIEYLANEGHIYSTVDDDHFKSTEDPV